MESRITPIEAVKYLEKINELLQFYIGGRESVEVKELMRDLYRTKGLIKELADDKFKDRKRFRLKFQKFFGKQKERLEQELKETKIELKRERGNYE